MAVVLEQGEEAHSTLCAHPAHHHAIQVLIPIKHVGGGTSRAHEVHELLGAVAVGAEERARSQPCGVHVCPDRLRPSRGEHAREGEGNHPSPVLALQQRPAVSHACLEVRAGGEVEHRGVPSHVSGRGQGHARPEDDEGRPRRGPLLCSRLLSDPPQSSHNGLNERLVPDPGAHMQGICPPPAGEKLTKEEGLHGRDDAAGAAAVLVESKREGGGG
mmetsp:Transcript_9803/g.28933  ORF Transcript_9803/g.28933 Transcript_9803/m.28933 type:complete len:216 (+) Transcript_9803:477-1124(+)